MTRRLWVVAGGTRTTASTRHRLWNYRPFLEADGVELRWTEYEGGRTESPLRAARERAAFLGRLLLPVPPGATVLVQKVLLPGPLLERWRADRHRIVYDFDDALFAPVPWGEDEAAVARRRARLDRMLLAADHVIAGSPPLADYARAHARAVEVLYPSLDREAVGTPAPRADDGTLRVGWIGNDQSQRYLLALVPVLTPIFARRPGLRLCVCSSRPPELPGPLAQRLEFVPWSEAAEREATARFDVAISPMDGAVWSRARGGRVSVLRSMAAGVPVVAAPGGGLETLCGTRGVRFAEEPEEWRQEIEALLDDPVLRTERGREARAVVDASIWADVQYPRLRAILFPEW
ncbi:MAG: glycosyltransferase [Gemmatimonadota bacterium]|nr:glycosyltransferase family 4 protein [Gemmatimonadota bacterium]